MADTIEQLRSDFEKLKERSGRLYDDTKQLYLDMEKFGNRLRDFAEAGRGSSSAARAKALEALEPFSTQSNGFLSPQKSVLPSGFAPASGAASRRIGSTTSSGTAFASHQNSSSSSASRESGGVVPRQTSEQRSAVSLRTVEASSSVSTASMTSAHVAKASFPVLETSVPASSCNESEKIKAFVDDYNLVRRKTGFGAKTEQDAFLSRHQVRGIQCTNFQARANHPEIAPRFEDAGAPQKGDFWALFIGSNLYAVVPNAKPYEVNKHNTGGMKEAFDSNYDSGTYPNIEVTKPAYFRQQGTDWTIETKGHIRLSRA